jgi:hypothetical protein
MGYPAAHCKKKLGLLATLVEKMKDYLLGGEREKKSITGANAEAGTKKVAVRRPHTAGL